MAQSRFDHPDFGTREEDWPDMDIDSDTSEGREQAKIADEAFSRSISRSIAACRNRQPSFSNVPNYLYEKAEVHQDQLTDEERMLLLSRRDMIGKVLGCPDLLTNEEIYDFMRWPSPEVVRTNIQNATNGSCSTPAELHAKMKAVLDRGEKLETVVSDAELILPARGFHALDDDTYNPDASLVLASLKGHQSASSLLFNRIGLTGRVMQASCIYYLYRGRPDMAASFEAETNERLNLVPHEVNVSLERMVDSFARRSRGELSDLEFATRIRDQIANLKVAAGPPPITYAPLDTLIESLTTIWQEEEQRQVSFEESMKRHALARGAFNDARNGNRVKEERAVFAKKERDWLRDQLGSDLWPPPPAPESVTPFKLFCRNESPSLSWFDQQSAWKALPEERKEAYRAQDEEMRLAAWEEHRKLAAERANPIPPPAPIPDPPELITDLMVFRDERYPGMECFDVIPMLEELPSEQQEEYGARAAQINDAAYAEWLGVMRHESVDPIPPPAPMPNPPELITDLMVFRDEHYPSIEYFDVIPMLKELSPEQRQEYKARAARINDAAQTEWLEAMRRRSVNPILPSAAALPPPVQRQRRYEPHTMEDPTSPPEDGSVWTLALISGTPKRPKIMTDLMVFRDERYPGMECFDVIPKLEELSSEEQDEYKARAERMNDAAHTEWLQAFQQSD